MSLPQHLPIETSGLGPYVTRRVILRGDGSRLIWHSRHHRKGLLAPELAALRSEEGIFLCSLWMPNKLNWWVTFTNLIGCLAFMASAFFAFVPSEPMAFDAGGVSIVFTLIGAMGFLVGSILLLPETYYD